jgi:hypothetical protein
MADTLGIVHRPLLASHGEAITIEMSPLHPPAPPLGFVGLPHVVRSTSLKPAFPISKWWLLSYHVLAYR